MRVNHILNELYNRYIKDRNVTIISKELSAIQIELANICISNGTDVRISPVVSHFYDSIYSESMNTVWIDDILIEISLSTVGDIKFCYIKFGIIDLMPSTSVVDDDGELY